MQPVFGVLERVTPVLSEARSIYIIDVSNVAHMCNAAKNYRDFKTSTGLPSGHIFGAMTKLLSWLKKFGTSPVHFVFVYDTGRGFKEAIYPEYKSHRPTSANNSDSPIPDIKRLFECIPSTSAWLQDHEADDVIASVAAQTSFAQEVFIFSTDRDMWQLIEDDITVVGFNGHPVSDKDVLTKYGFNCSQSSRIALHKSVWGDSGDNVPRISRLSEPNKKNGPDILKLVKASDGTPGDFLRLVKESDLHDTPKTKILEGADQIIMCYGLVNLFRDLNYETKINNPKPNRMRNILKHYECRSLLDKVGVFYG